MVEEELARAIKNESAMALSHRWGVSSATVLKWRRAFGIYRTATEGSRKLIGATAIGALNARHQPHWGEVRLWTDEELGMLARLPDAEVSKLTERTVEAVAKMRTELHQRLNRAKRSRR